LLFNSEWKIGLQKYGILSPGSTKLQSFGLFRNPLKHAKMKVFREKLGCLVYVNTEHSRIRPQRNREF